MADKFQVGDRVQHQLSQRMATVVGVNGRVAWVDVGGDGAHRDWLMSEMLLITPRQRPIQPGDYIKDPGPRPVDDPPLGAGELCYDHQHLTVMRVASGDDTTVRYGDNSGGWDSRRSVRRLPPDAILDEERSPRRDGAPVVDMHVDVSGNFVKVKRVASSYAVTLPPTPVAEVRDAQMAAAMMRDHRALLTRALALVSGLNLQHHSVTRAQFETAQALARDMVKVLKPGRG